jgi:hypothetical protein
MTLLIPGNLCPKSLRKNRQKRRVPPSRDLITRCSGWISLIQRFRTPVFRRFAPLGLPGSRLIGTPLGNPLFMPPPPQFEQVAQPDQVVGQG